MESDYCIRSEAEHRNLEKQFFINNFLRVKMFTTNNKGNNIEYGISIVQTFGSHIKICILEEHFMTKSHRSFKRQETII